MLTFEHAKRLIFIVLGLHILSIWRLELILTKINYRYIVTAISSREAILKEFIVDALFRYYVGLSTPTHAKY